MTFPGENFIVNGSAARSAAMALLRTSSAFAFPTQARRDGYPLARSAATAY